MLQVSETPVNQSPRPRGHAAANIFLVDDNRSQASRSSVARNAESINASTHDDEVVGCAGVAGVR
jgi:hypothetical protein